MSNSDTDHSELTPAKRHIELMRAVATAQDKQAFAELFRHFAPRLHVFSQKLGCQPTAADELVQETMSKVWRKAAQFNADKAAVSTWIYTIARNLHIDNIRRENRPTPDPHDPAMVPREATSPLESVSRDQEASRLRAALDELSPEQKQILELAFFQEKTHSVIAAELDLPLGTVKSRIRLALRHVRSAIGEQL